MTEQIVIVDVLSSYSSGLLRINYDPYDSPRSYMYTAGFTEDLLKILFQHFIFVYLMI